MKDFKHLVFLLLALASTLTATAETFKGRVLDKDTNEPLIGATIMIKGTTMGVTTDIDGNFELSVADGSDYTLSISYISYATQELMVHGDASDMTIQLETDSQSIEVVSVTARVNRESEYAAIADQRASIVATQVVGARELSRKGVSDAEGAVMKVSGISKQEGVKNVFVRGLGDRYNSTTLNGLPIPSEDPEYKNISLDFFSTDVIQSVNVNKAFYATGASDVGGANIDVASKRLSGDGEFNISISGGVNSQTIGAELMNMDGVNAFGFASSTQPESVKSSYNFENQLTTTSMNANFNGSVGVSGGKRFEIGGNPLTFYLVAGYDRGTSYREEEVRSSGTGGSVFRDQSAAISEINTSYLALANINYMMNQKHSIDYNFMYVHSNSESVGVYDGFYSNFEDWGGYDSQSGVIVRQQANDNSMYINQLISSWELSQRLKLDAAASYNLVVGLEPDRRINSYGLESDGSYTQASGDSANQRFFSELRDGDLNVKAVLNYALSGDKSSKSALKVGYFGRFVNNEFNATQYNHSINNQSSVSSSNLMMDEFFNTSSMQNGNFSVGEIDSYYQVTKNIHSIFADATYEFSERLIANFGLKYDIVDINVVADLNGVTDEGGISNKGYFLPSANLRYSVNRDHSLRLSASKSYTLPQAKELSPYQYLGSNFTSQGNADLKPSDNYNVDVKWDWYISGSEIFSITGFYKHIVNPISRIDIGGSAAILSYENISDKAVATGVEVEFRKNLFSQDLGDDKSNKLSLGVNGSYIFTEAKVDMATDTSGSQLEGAAPYIVNADLSMVMNRQRRVFTNTVVFNYVSDKTYTIGTIGYNDIIEKATMTLDFVSSAKINDKLTLSLKAKNLLNSDFVLERESSTTTESIVLSRYKKGIDVSVGLSLSF
ncbi:MAG: TonB-dependent receptor [Rikenellaceae bacterium]